MTEQCSLLLRWQMNEWASIVIPPTHGATASCGPGPSHCYGFTVKVRHTIACRTTVDRWSSWSRDLYLTTHNTYKRKTSITAAGFELTIPASERPQTCARPLESTFEQYLEKKIKTRVKKNPSQCHFAEHKSHAAWPGIAPGPSQWEAGN